MWNKTILIKKKLKKLQNRHKIVKQNFSTCLLKVPRAQTIRAHYLFDDDWQLWEFSIFCNFIGKSKKSFSFLGN